MKKLFFSLFMLASVSTFAQEICDNGVDDDADGLIDMNDPDCACSGFGGGSQQVTSLIPNPSFEDYTCCPNSVSDLNCAVSWQQASNATSDYFNLCGYTGIFNSPNTPLPGGGAGYGGFYSNQNWEENIGACLNSPMTAGTSYTMQLNTAWSTGSQSLELTIYGTPNCGDLPWNTSSCAVGSGQWMVLGSVIVNYPANQSWQQVTINFTPPVDINAVSIGGPCGGMPGTNYYFLDELTLASSASFSPGTITESGNWCNNDLILTADADTSGGSYQWFEDGVVLPGETDSILDIMSYGAGTYNVVYTLGTDCIQMDYTITIPGAPTADFNFTNQCDGNPINFTDASTVTAPAVITNWDWDFGDGNTSTGQSPSNNYANDGTYNVSLTVTDDNGCQNTMQQNVTVYPNPVTDFEFVVGGVSSNAGATGGCLIDPVSFVNNSTINAPDNITTWAWDFGDGNTSNVQTPPAHTYAAVGNYTITLNTTSNNGCTGQMQIPIVVDPSPVPVFTVTDNCLDFAATFTENSNISAGTISNYDWDFGDGNTSTAQNPGSHQYAADGQYTVTLTLTSDQGCISSATAQTTQFPEPVSDFTMSTECIGNANTINNNSSVGGGGTITTYSWDFDDGNTSAVQNPGSHSYASENIYNVMLAVETADGCQDTSYQSVGVHAQPVADFSIFDTCAYDPAVFTNNSSVALGSITGFTWDFGDGNSASTSDPSNLYAADGNYNVTLTVTTDQGCTDDTTIVATIHPVPVPAFTINDECVFDPVTVTENVAINSGSIVNWDWDYGDGNTGNGATASNAYQSYGPYTVSLTATSDQGCIASTTMPVTIHALPVINWTATDVCVNTPPNEFTDASSVPSGSVASWNWDFGDGSNGTGQTTTHIYGSDGTYNANLTVTSAFGCISNLIQPVTVWEKPTAIFTADTLAVCSPYQIVYTDQSTGILPITDWRWDFFGGTGANIGPTTTINYVNNNNWPEPYDVQLIVTNDKGCSDTVLYNDYVTIYPTPEARFNATPNPVDVLESEVHFTNGSINSDEWDWDLGDGTLSNEQTPTHTYPSGAPGTYNVELIAYNYGRFCSDTAWMPVFVEDVIIFYVPNIFTPDGDEYNETWNPIFYSGYDIYDFHLTVFNRWGEIIWETYDASKGWNGHYGAGGLVDDGVYIWQLDFKETFTDKRHKHNGHVTVLK